VCIYRVYLRVASLVYITVVYLRVASLVYICLPGVYIPGIASLRCVYTRYSLPGVHLRVY